jgi:pilus assembly protein CpaB
VSTRRTLIIIIAVVVGAVAAFATYAYVHTAQERAYDHAKLVQVFKVNKPIPKGTTGDDAIKNEWVKSGRIPQEFRPGTAITSTATLKGKVALTALSPGEIIVDGQFVDPRTAQITASQRLPAGQVSVTVSVDQVNGVGGNLVPGDKVNLLVTDKGDPTNPVKVLYQNVNILFIGQVAAPQPGETQAVTPTTAGVITFAVPPEAASRIVFASQQLGGLYLSLVPPDNAPVQVPPVGKNNTFVPQLTPYPGQ